MTSRVLVLNSAFQPINDVSPARAVDLVHRGRAEALDVYEDVFVSSAKTRFQVPSVIRLKRYVQVPKLGTTWNPKAMFRRDNYTCQYCGLKLDATAKANSKFEPTVDHIVPKSRCPDRMKVSTWGNTCCACHVCQRRKADKLMGEAGMKFHFPNYEPKMPRVNYLLAKSDLNPAWKLWLRTG